MDFKSFTLNLALLILLGSIPACLGTGNDQVTNILKSSGKGLELSDGSFYDFPQVSEGDSTTLFFLLHHAEAAEGSEDPYLSTGGRMRSHHLNEVLGHAGIQLIFTTSKRKCMSTVEVLSTMNSIQTLGYTADKAGDLVQTVMEKDKGRRILIVGTADDLQAVLEAIQPEGQAPEAIDGDYEGIIICRKGTQTACRRFIY